MELLNAKYYLFQFMINVGFQFTEYFLAAKVNFIKHYFLIGYTYKLVNFFLYIKHKFDWIFSPHKEIQSLYYKVFKLFDWSFFLGSSSQNECLAPSSHCKNGVAHFDRWHSFVIFIVFYPSFFFERWMQINH